MVTMMIDALRIYTELFNDLNSEHYSNYQHIERSIVLANRIRIIYLVVRQTSSRIIAVSLPEKYDINFPKWKGIEFQTGSSSIYSSSGDSKDYIFIKQCKEYDGKIFEIIANDISKKLDSLSDISETVFCLQNTLNRWRKFFQTSRDIILSEIEQIGLYGELLVLKKLIQEFNADAVEYWTGPNKETHDFYVNGNAIEVKTTSVNSGDKVKISSEYQLDYNDVEKQLILYVNTIRKSNSDGETLNSVIEDIRLCLDETNRESFDEKLFWYGYLEAYKDKYKLGFHLRKKEVYKIGTDFPSITPIKLSKGISGVSYYLDLNICQDYMTSWENCVKEIREN